MPKGDCYEAAGRYMMDHRENEDLYLVHAMVTGQQETAGLRHGHAFVFDGGIVYDYSNDKKLEIPAVIYFHVGQITSEEATFYSHQDMAKMFLKHEHWGPWTPMKEYKMKRGKKDQVNDGSGVGFNQNPPIPSQVRKVESSRQARRRIERMKTKQERKK